MTSDSAKTNVVAPGSCPPWHERVRGAIFVATLSITLLLTVFYLFISDRTWWGEYITIWPSLFWLCGLLPLAFLTLSRRKLGRFFAAIAAILLFQAVTVEWGSLLRFPLTPLGMKDADYLRVVTWNIDSGSGGKEAILRILEEQGADIYFLQETPDGGASFQDEDLTGYFKGFTWIDSGDTGILSRYPATELPTKRVGPWEPPQLASIELPTSRTLVVANVRLMLPSLVLNPLSSSQRERLKADHRARTEQFEALADLMKDYADGPTMIAGDFNTPAGMASLKPLKDTWRDAWRESGTGWGATMTNQFPVSRIDQVWISREIKGMHGEVVAPALSDHRLVVCRVAVRGGEE